MKPGDLIWIDAPEDPISANRPRLWKERCPTSIDNFGDLEHGAVGLVIEVDPVETELDLCLFEARYGYVNRRWLRQVRVAR